MKRSVLVLCGLLAHALFKASILYLAGFPQAVGARGAINAGAGGREDA